MNTQWKGRSIAVATGLLLLLGFGPAGASDNIDRTVKAAKDGHVSIENVAGEVTVNGWDREEVRVVGTLGRRVDEVEIDTDEDGDVRIEVVVPDHMRGGGYDAELVISVPKGARVDVETVSASIRVEGMTGSVDLESVSGAVDVEGNLESVEVATVSGAIDVRGTIPRVNAESVSGQVDLRDVTGDVEVSTTSGGIEIRGGKLGDVSVESVSGRVVFEGGLRKNAHLDVESFSGSVILYLPADLGADIEAETFSGSIESDFGGRPRREEFGPGEWLDVTVGDGSARIDVSSFSASIRIEKR